MCVRYFANRKLKLFQEIQNKVVLGLKIKGYKIVVETAIAEAKQLYFAAKKIKKSVEKNGKLGLFIFIELKEENIGDEQALEFGGKMDNFQKHFDEVKQKCIDIFLKRNNAINGPFIFDGSSLSTNQKTEKLPSKIQSHQPGNQINKQEGGVMSML